MHFPLTIVLLINAERHVIIINKLSIYVLINNNKFIGIAAGT